MTNDQSRVTVRRVRVSIVLLYMLLSGCQAVPPKVVSPGVPPVPAHQNAGAPGVSILLAAPGAPGRLYAVMTPGGYDLFIPTGQARLMYSDDNAATWQPWPGGLPVESTCLNGMNLDYGIPDALYASTCQGLFVWANLHG